MSLLSENVIPGNSGKIFETNANKESDLERIKNKIFLLKGIKDVKINSEVFPKEITVYTSKLVEVKDIEKKVRLTGFHAIPKDFLEF